MNSSVEKTLPIGSLYERIRVENYGKTIERLARRTDVKRERLREPPDAARIERAACEAVVDCRVWLFGAHAGRSVR